MNEDSKSGKDRREFLTAVTAAVAAGTVGTFATSAQAQGTFSAAPMNAMRAGAGRLAVVPRGVNSVFRPTSQTFDVYLGKPAGSTELTAFVGLSGENSAALAKSLGTSPITATISGGVLRVGGLAGGAASRSAGAMKEIGVEAGMMHQ